MARHLRIGLVLPHSLAYCRGVMRGIKEFAEQRPEWILLPVQPEADSVRSLAKLRPAGILAHLFAPEVARAVEQLGRPAMNVSGAMERPPAPRVGTDDFACGQLAASHFLDCGYRHFAFVGHWDHQYSVERERGFRAALESRNLTVESYHAPRGQPFDPLGRLWSLDEGLHRWLKQLPGPVGLFASNDIWGLQLTEVCRQAGRSVPEDVAILGVDNDDLLCGLARPSLSSIAIPSERIGYEAASRLDRLLSGRPVAKKPLLFGPLGVVPRRSSDVLAISDADVAQAVRFIRDNAHRPLRVTDVLQAVAVSRRGLERRFRGVLRRTLLDEIRRVHIERARELLSQTSLSMHEIAERSGFSDAKQFSVVFRQLSGTSPSEYRRTTRGSHPTSQAMDRSTR